MSRRKTSKKTVILSVICIFVLIPLTGFICYKAGDTNMYVASVIIMILAMAPFFISFEGRHPDAREMSVLAVMVALTTVSRFAFAMLPSFKPMGGFVVITALSFGPGTGFMTGALSMIVSNMLFGQGPWTPWQMFCYGMIGFVGGLLGRRRLISEKHAMRSAILTFIIVFVLAGVILDTCSVFLMSQYNTTLSVAAIYAAGVPYNIGNATSSAICVFLLIKPLTFIINRIKIKYGLE